MNNQNVAFNTGLFVTAVCVGGVVGLLCGLIPLLVGINRKQVPLGVVGFACSGISGAILGLLLALPVSLIFMGVILAVSSGQPARRRRRYDDEADDYDDRPRRPDEDDSDGRRRSCRDEEDDRRRSDDRFRPRDEGTRRDDY